MDVLKRTFTMGVVLTTILWSLGVAALVPGAALAVDQGDEVDCDSVTAGEMVKIHGGAAIYFINDDMSRSFFPDGDVFKSWNADDDYSDYYVYVTSECMSDFPTGGAVMPRPGSYLVSEVGSSVKYAVLPGNKLAKVTSEVAEALYGDREVLEMSPATWGYFATAANLTDDLTEVAPHEGMLVMNGDDYYYVGADMTLRKVTDEGLTANRYRTAFAYELESTDGYTMGDDVEALELDLTDRSQGLEGSGETGDDDETPVVGGALTVALAADTPASGYVYKNSTHNRFTKVNLTAGSEAVVIDSMVVERTGSPASDAAFTGVNVLKADGSLLSSSYKSLNSTHQATFTEDITIPANTTISLYLLGKMANSSTYGGEVPTLSLVEVNSNASSESMNLPLEGNAMTINTTVTIGVATISESPDLSTLTEEVGTENVTFLNVKVANDSGSNIDLQMENIRFNNAGSADDADVDNLELVVDGNVVATGEMVSNYVSFDLSAVAAAKILNGKTETFTLRGDIVGGSGRNLDFDVKKADDIMVKDLLNGAYPTPSAAINGGRIVTISRGTLNVSKTNTVQAGNIPKDTNDVQLGSWNFKVAGEPITINGLRVDLEMVSASTMQAADFTSCKLSTASKNLTGATDGSGAGDGAVTFTDSFGLPIGDNEVFLTCNINSDPTAAETIQAAIDLSATGDTAYDATGDVTGDTITRATYALPASEIDANILTITDLALAVTTLSQPAAQTIAAGTVDHLFSKIQFSAADSAEDVKVTAFEIYASTTGNAKALDLQNITFVVDGTTLTEVKNGSESTVATGEEISVALSGDDQFVVPKGSIVVMEVYADVAGGAAAAGTYKLDITSTNSNVVTAQGATSGNDITESYSTAVANVMTIGTAGGTVEISLSSDNPNASLMAAGTEVELAAFKFYATSTENIELDYLYLTQVVTDTNSSSYKDYDQIWFEDEEGNEIAGTRTTPTSTKPKVNFSDDAFVVDYTDTDGQILYLKANLAAIGTAANGVSDHYLGYKINAAGDVVAKGALSGSGATEYLSSGSAPTGNTHYVYTGYPQFTKVALTNNLANGTNDLFKFTVTAVNSDIALYSFVFDIATTGCEVTNLYVYDVTSASNETVLNDTAGTGGGTGWAYLTNGAMWQTTGSNWTTNYSGREVTVSKKAPRTFVLRGDVTGAASGDSVSVKLGGDAAHVAGTDTLLHTAAEVYADANNDFIWSDKSAGAHTYATDDWTNGYLVYGLPSTSSSAEVTSL